MIFFESSCCYKGVARLSFPLKIHHTKITHIVSAINMDSNSQIPYEYAHVGTTRAGVHFEIYAANTVQCVGTHFFI